MAYGIIWFSTLKTSLKVVSSIYIMHSYVIGPLKSYPVKIYPAVLSAFSKLYDSACSIAYIVTPPPIFVSLQSVDHHPSVYDQAACAYSTMNERRLTRPKCFVTKIARYIRPFVRAL